jgi:hypothetical protein
MGHRERRAWLLERFGSDGQSLFSGLPGMLRECHLGMADAQKVAPLKSRAVYGQIWRAMHDAIEDEFGSLPTAQLIRPDHAPYKVLVVKGTVVFPWRFADNDVADIDQASFGSLVSATRETILSGRLSVPPMLPIGDVDTDGEGDDVEAIERYRAVFRRAVDEHSVVVVAYASNSSALLSAYWGDVMELRQDGSLEWGYREQIDLTTPVPPKRRLTTADSERDRPSFATGPLTEPAVRPRQRPVDAGQAGSGHDRRA